MPQRPRVVSVEAVDLVVEGRERLLLYGLHRAGVGKIRLGKDPSRTTTYSCSKERRSPGWRRKDPSLRGEQLSDAPRGAPERLRGRAAAPHHGGHPALREDAAAAAEPGDRDRVRGRDDSAVVRERRGAPGGSHAERRFRDPERPSSGLPGRFRLSSRGVVQPRAFVRQVPGVQLPHGAHAAVHGASGRGGAQRHRGARLHDNDAGSKIHLLANPGQDVAPIGAARQEDSLLESQMQLGSLQYPHNPMKGASEHFHFLSVLAGTYDDTVRNIDIDRAGYLRHSFIAGFPTERVPKMPPSGVSTRSGDLARFTFKALDGTMTDVFIHLIAYQLVTLSGTGVSVLD